MNIIKDIIVDLIVLAAIAALLFIQNDILEIIIWVYTGLLLAGKIMALFMPSLQRRANKSATPDWVYHLIYLSSIAILIWLSSYYLAGVWGVVWMLSIVSSQKPRASRK